MIRHYREKVQKNVMEEALNRVRVSIDTRDVDLTITRFTEFFPPLAVHKGLISPANYLEQYSESRSHWEIELEEMILLSLANANPAFSPFKELFDDYQLIKTTSFKQIMDHLENFFGGKPVFPGGGSLLDFLRKPMLAAPDSLAGQLEYIRNNWGKLIGDHFRKLLSSLDFISEEEQIRFAGPGPSYAPSFDHLDPDWEKYSPDSDWMPKVVMLAKNAYVWLDQLSKKYNRSIRILSEVPDEELDLMAGRGFTGLWLIGLWERSQASQKIKQIMGNEEAVASAYSLLNYEIASDLGGWDAFNNLKERAWKRGIRMGGDMVPNHMGIDSDWVTHHSDWFISLDHPPFPSYSFNGPNLSHDARVGIYLEDHYYDHSDAAVVFKRVDHWTGDTRYVYHGNDGTSMPWNDTAQLNYLMAEVREAVIQTILHVARQFPIIRFDAAMTLVKRHIQRLWFPEPGSGGAIPSRAGHAVDANAFHEMVPTEFWREVVDRVAAEAPGTLLLAEAFWMLEGYFVRTLGMHRVYNSAFMNMLKNEENAKYREAIKTTLAFDPRILKRYVNFMNNPDEDTAIAQFGKDDKYFGVCLLLSTMPGLPMFGHGQIEGYAEKYGMEFKQAYWNETPDTWLIQRHHKEIFPLLRKRYLFADVEQFVLYDCFTSDGSVNENVFAYSNRSGEERALILFHNQFAEARGWIKTSVGILSGDHLIQKTLGEGLDLPDDPHAYCLFTDYITGLRYIRNCHTLHTEGLYLELGAFKYHAFMDFQIVRELSDGYYGQALRQLNGQGTADMTLLLREIRFQPVIRSFRMLTKAERLNQFKQCLLADSAETLRSDFLQSIQSDLESFLMILQTFTHSPADPKFLQDRILADLKISMDLFSGQSKRLNLNMKSIALLDQKILGDTIPPSAIFIWLIFLEIGRFFERTDYHADWPETTLLAKTAKEKLIKAGANESAAGNVMGMIELLAGDDVWTAFRESGNTLPDLLKTMSGNKTLLGINEYEQTLWFKKEPLEMLLSWIFIAMLIDLVRLNESRNLRKPALELYQAVQSALDNIPESGYRWESYCRLSQELKFPKLIP